MLNGMVCFPPKKKKKKPDRAFCIMCLYRGCNNRRKGTNKAVTVTQKGGKE